MSSSIWLARSVAQPHLGRLARTRSTARSLRYLTTTTSIGQRPLAHVPGSANGTTKCLHSLTPRRSVVPGMAAASPILSLASRTFSTGLALRSSTLEQPTAPEPGTTAASAVEQAACTTDAPDTVAQATSAVDVEALTTAAMNYGDLQAMGLVNYTPAGAVQAFLEAVHVSTGLPWWSTIAVCTLLLRLFLFRIAVRNLSNTIRLHNIKPETERISYKIKHAKEMGDQAQLMSMGSELNNLFNKYNCHPASILGPTLLQAGVFISFFMGIRGMANLPVPQLMKGGLWWFTDLTVPDPLMILPVVSCASMLLSMELGGLGTPPSMSDTKSKYIMRGVTLGSIFFAVKFPAAVLVYWTATNLFTILQVLVLRIPFIRRYFDIPERKHIVRVVPQKGLVDQIKDAYKQAKEKQKQQEQKRF
ncbi:hypothetical protein H4R35_000175 [Dimargaris xerosporica]|nr:hypothetical protein H4R35_000175 [Dimargaris xerosporica]